LSYAVAARSRLGATLFIAPNAERPLLPAVTRRQRRRSESGKVAAILLDLLALQGSLLDDSERCGAVCLPLMDLATMLRVDRCGL